MKLKIGNMTRAMDQDSEFRAYAEGLVENMGLPAGDSRPD